MGRPVRVLALLLVPALAFGGPLTSEVVTEAPEWYVPSNPPKPDGCEFSERFDNHGRRMVEAPAECLDWLFLRAEEANESARQLLALRQWVEVVLPALDGQANARGEAIRIARRQRARDVVLTNSITNAATAGLGIAAGFGICSAAN